jgi:hypothetical protein
VILGDANGKQQFDAERPPQTHLKQGPVPHHRSVKVSSGVPKVVFGKHPHRMYGSFSRNIQHKNEPPQEGPQFNPQPKQKPELNTKELRTRRQQRGEYRSIEFQPREW